nr:hypothetical protein [Clostridia bacterium]
MFRKTACLLLSALMLMSLIACSSDTASDDNSPADTTAADTVDIARSDDAAETEYPAPELDGVTFDGASFNVMISNPDNTRSYSPEETGDSFMDAMYYRDIDIAEELEIEFVYKIVQEAKDVFNAVNQSVLAGDDTYDLVNNHIMIGVPEMLTAGCLTDIAVLPNVDLDAPWWNKSIMDTLTVKGKLMYAANDYVIPQAVGMVLNRDMVEDMKLEDPYKIVNDGLWTIDKMTELAVSVAADLNGDGVYNTGDRFGISAHLCWRWASFLYAGGLHVAEIDNDGIAHITLNNDRMFSLIEKLDALIYNTNAAHKPQNFNNGNDLNVAAEVRRSFMEGNTLLLPETIGFAMNQYRDTEVNYGIIPLPKLNEGDEYVTNSWEGLVCVPITVDTPDMTGAVLEMLAYKTRTDVFPVYYTELMGEKIARDTESKEMLDMIFDSITYDFGLSLIGYNNFSYSVAKMLREGTTDFASYYAANEAAVQAKIDAVYDSVK